MADALAQYRDLEEAAARGLRVLVVEDHPVNRQIMTLMLERLPARVTCAENGAEGVEAFLRQAFDVVLMDLRMPLMDGYEAMRRIRAAEAVSGAARTPIVVISAHTTPKDVKVASDAGADHHLGKPLHIPELLSTLDRVLQAKASVARPDQRQA